LGESVAVYLDGGPCADNVPSTILDLTGTVPRMLRAGAISVDALRKVVPVIDLPVTPAIVEEEMSPADRRAAETIAAAGSAGTVQPGEAAEPAEPAAAPADDGGLADQGPGA
jgi:L-threonylcarbamoyladenylate synthase